jgi:hypothetical protein
VPRLAPLDGLLLVLVLGLRAAAAPSPPADPEAARYTVPAPTNLRVVSREPGRALLEWDAVAMPGGVQGYKLRPSPVAGSHPDPVGWPDGRLAAFTWTTDDGFDDNLLYATSFASRGLSFTAFVNPLTIGRTGKLTWSDVRTLHLAGVEIGTHTQNHIALIDDRALAIRYTGAEACTLRVFGDSLTTRLGTGGIDVALHLADPAVDHLVDLAGWLDARAGYEATLLYSDLEISATQSTFLDPVAELAIGGAVPETLTTDRGVHDDAEMAYEIGQSVIEIEGAVSAVDPDYRCRTLSYPNHAHRQWAMTALNEAGFLGARSGNPGERPFFSEGTFPLGFTTTYEVPMSFPRPENAWTEEFTREKYDARMIGWKLRREWAVIMAHHEGESDAQHVEWMIDEIAADPDVWIASFGEVMRFLETYFQDVGNPDDGTGTTARAWLNDLDDSQATWVVVTAYDPHHEESGWSNEILLPALEPPPASSGPGPRVAARPVGAAPNPFVSATRIRFRPTDRGPLTWNVYDVRGSRVRFAPGTPGELRTGEIRWDGRDGSGRRVPAGVYFVRIRTGDVDLPSVKVVRTGGSPR